jgi:hypothetical protein
MNRIQELADQAKKNVPGGLGVDKWIEVYNEKLALLIVEECINVLKDSVANYDDRASFHPRHIAEQATILVNKYFGVKE